MAETTDSGRESTNQRHEGADMTASKVDAWFAREVLPMETVLAQFLRNNWRDKSEVSDLLQDVYVRIYEAALKQIPNSTKQFVFQIARNLLIDRARHERVVSFETLADVEALSLVADTPSPEQSVIARDELLRLRAGLDRLPVRSREALVLRQIEGLSRHEIAQRMNISDNTVKWHLAEGLRLLADIMYGESAEAGGRA